MSKNRPTMGQIKLACRHVVEQMEQEGMSENWAIRLLEQLTNMYAKYRALGYVAPDRVHQYDHWSRAARKAKRANNVNGTYLVRARHAKARLCP